MYGQLGGIVGLVVVVGDLDGLVEFGYVLQVIGIDVVIGGDWQWSIGGGNVDVGCEGDMWGVVLGEVYVQFQCVLC